MPEGHEQKENEHDQHDGAAQRELSDLAPQVLDLHAAGPDAEPGLIGAREMPYQEPSGDRKDNGPHKSKPIWGDWTGCVYLTAPGCGVSNGRHYGRVARAVCHCEAERTREPTCPPSAH
jgi:hypothetical protein